MNPATLPDALELLRRLGAPAHLQRHVNLVGEAADELLGQFTKMAVDVDHEFVRIGVVFHDIGKIRHPIEMSGPGSEHEPEGERMLLAAQVSADLARVCLSHARWNQMECSLEELLVALADKLWKGVRNGELEERVIAEAARRSNQQKWDIFVGLDAGFERVADGGGYRLMRSGTP